MASFNPYGGGGGGGNPNPNPNPHPNQAMYNNGHNPYGNVQAYRNAASPPQFYNTYHAQHQAAQANAGNVLGRNARNDSDAFKPMNEEESEEDYETGSDNDNEAPSKNAHAQQPHAQQPQSAQPQPHAHQPPQPHPQQQPMQYPYQHQPPQPQMNMANFNQPRMLNGANNRSTFSHAQPKPPAQNFQSNPNVRRVVSGGTHMQNMQPNMQPHMPNLQNMMQGGMQNFGGSMMRFNQFPNNNNANANGNNNNFNRGGFNQFNPNQMQQPQPGPQQQMQMQQQRMQQQKLMQQQQQQQQLLLQRQKLLQQQAEQQQQAMLQQQQQQKQKEQQQAMLQQQQKQKEQQQQAEQQKQLIQQQQKLLQEAQMLKERQQQQQQQQQMQERQKQQQAQQQQQLMQREQREQQERQQMMIQQQQKLLEEAKQRRQQPSAHPFLPHQQQQQNGNGPNQNQAMQMQQQPPAQVQQPPQPQHPLQAEDEPSYMRLPSLPAAAHEEEDQVEGPAQVPVPPPPPVPPNPIANPIVNPGQPKAAPRKPPPRYSQRVQASQSYQQPPPPPMNVRDLAQMSMSVRSLEAKQHQQHQPLQQYQPHQQHDHNQSASVVSSVSSSAADDLAAPRENLQWSRSAEYGVASQSPKLAQSKSSGTPPPPPVQIEDPAIASPAQKNKSNNNKKYNKKLKKSLKQKQARKNMKEREMAAASPAVPPQPDANAAEKADNAGFAPTVVATMPLPPPGLPRPPAWSVGPEDEDVDGAAAAGAGVPPPVPEVLDDGIKKLQNGKTRRQMAMEELLATESTYVFQLKKLIKLYVNKLKDKPKAISAKDLQIILPPSLNTIFQLNTTLLSDLRKRKRENDNTIKHSMIISDILLNFAPYFKMYQEYIRSSTAQLTKVSECMRNEHFFKHVQETRPMCGNLTLNDMVILPVQRIPRYKLLVQEILKRTESAHADFEGLTKALKLIEKVNLDNNEALKDLDARMKVLNITNEIEKAPNLASPSRKYVFSGELDRIKPNGKLERLVFFMFNDCVIYAQPPSMFGSKSVFKGRLQIDAAFGVQKIRETKKFKNVFAIYSSLESFLVTTGENARQRQAWMKVMESTINSAQHGHFFHSGQRNARMGRGSILISQAKLQIPKLLKKEMNEELARIQQEKSSETGGKKKPKHQRFMTQHQLALLGGDNAKIQVSDAKKPPLHPVLSVDIDAESSDEEKDFHHAQLVDDDSVVQKLQHRAKSKTVALNREKTPLDRVPIMKMSTLPPSSKSMRILQGILPGADGGSDDDDARDRFESVSSPKAGKLLGFSGGVPLMSLACDQKPKMKAAVSIPPKMQKSSSAQATSPTPEKQRKMKGFARRQSKSKKVGHKQKNAFSTTAASTTSAVHAEHTHVASDPIDDLDEHAHEHEQHAATMMAMPPPPPPLVSTFSTPMALTQSTTPRAGRVSDAGANTFKFGGGAQVRRNSFGGGDSNNGGQHQAEQSDADLQIEQALADTGANNHNSNSEYDMGMQFAAYNQYGPPSPMPPPSPHTPSLPSSSQNKASYGSVIWRNSDVDDAENAAMFEQMQNLMTDVEQCSYNIQCKQALMDKMLETEDILIIVNSQNESYDHALIRDIRESLHFDQELLLFNSQKNGAYQAPWLTSFSNIKFTQSLQDVLAHIKKFTKYAKLNALMKDDDEEESMSSHAHKPAASNGSANEQPPLIPPEVSDHHHATGTVVFHAEQQQQAQMPPPPPQVTQPPQPLQPPQPPSQAVMQPPAPPSSLPEQPPPPPVMAAAVKGPIGPYTGDPVPIWNRYLDENDGAEPNNEWALNKFCKSNELMPSLSFKQAREIFKKCKGKGRL